MSYDYGELKNAKVDQSQWQNQLFVFDYCCYNNVGIISLRYYIVSSVVYHLHKLKGTVYF